VESVSTEKILTLANRWNIPIYTIDETNIDEILPQLDTFDIVKQNIVDAINIGWTAIVPQSNIQLNQWYGAGWIIMDPDTGSAGYLLAGYLVSAGGSTSESTDVETFIEKGVKEGVVTTLIGALAGLAGPGAIVAVTGTKAIAQAVTAGSLILGLGGAATVFVGVAMVASAFILGYLFFRGYYSSMTFRRKWLACKSPAIVAG
jgi:hypothetical protein